MYQFHTDFVMIVLNIILILLIVYEMQTTWTTMHPVLFGLLFLFLMFVLGRLIPIMNRIFYYSGSWFHCYSNKL